MAEYLASIFATEKDKVNCSFYFKIGACRHGDRCSRIHNKPTFSQTVLILNLYCNPQNSAKSADGSHSTVSDEEMQEHYDLFFEEVFVELEDNYGEIEEMNVCDNLGDHLVGNVYIKFKFEEDAKRAVEDINNRWFNRRPMYAELSPVTDFREACCRQYEMGECTRSGFCNFMHLKPISRELRRELYGRKIRSRTKKGHKQSKKKKNRRHKHRKLSRSPITNHHSKSPLYRSGSASPDQSYGDYTNQSLNDMPAADKNNYSHGNGKVSNNSGKSNTLANSLSKFGSRNMNSENYSYSNSRSQNEFSYPHNRSKPLSDHNKRLDARSRSPPVSIGNYRYGSKRSPVPRSGQSRSSRSNSRDSHSFSSRSRSRSPKLGTKCYRTRSRSTKSRSHSHHSRSRSIISRSRSPRSRSRSSGSRSVKSRSRSPRSRSRSFHSRDRSSYSRSKSPLHPRYKGSRPISTFRYSRSRSPYYQSKGDSFNKKAPVGSNANRSQFKPYNSLAKASQNQSKSPFARLGSPSRTACSKSQFEKTRDSQCTSNSSQSLGTTLSIPKSSASLQNSLKSPGSQTEGDYMLNRPNSNTSQPNADNTVSHSDSSPSKSFLPNNYRKYPINQPGTANFCQNKSLVPHSNQRNVNNSKPPLISEVPLLSNAAPNALSKGPLMKTPLISRPPSVSSDVNNCYSFNINNEQMEMKFDNSLPNLHESNLEEVNNSNVNDFVRNDQCQTVVCDSMSMPRMDQNSMMAHSAAQNHHLATPQNTFAYTPHSLLANTNVSTAHHLAQSPAIHHSHFTSPNYQLAHHFNPLQALSPLMPAPPLLLGGLLGGFGRGLLGTGLLNSPAGHPLTLPGFRYGNFGGASRGPPTLQQQLAKAAAAARMSRPPF